MEGIILTYAILFFITTNTLAYGYDLNTDLARGLVYNVSSVVVTRLGAAKSLSDYPEDCASVYLNGKKLNQNVSTGIYEIWPREGIAISHIICSHDLFHTFVYVYFNRKTISSTM